MRSRSWLLLALIAIVVCASAPHVFAAGEGRIIGAVTDVDGAPIAGATVTLIREGTEFKVQKTTSEDGSFAMVVLDASAAYRIHISKEHFLPVDASVKLVSGEIVRETYVMMAVSPTNVAGSGQKLLPTAIR